MSKPRRGRIALVVLDGLGIGAAPDAADYGDSGSNTLANVAKAVGGLELPYMSSLGLGCIRHVDGLACGQAEAAFGAALPRSPGKDSTTGHWEICEVLLDEPFPTYPGGFPEDVIDAFERGTGRKVIGNVAASGTTIIEDLGESQLETGAWIVYTSADSVFQVAAHEDLIPLEELYAACEHARREILVGGNMVSRVIARPFVGNHGSFRRTANRRDFSVAPVRPTLLERLADAGVARVGVGKVDDLFAGRAISSQHTPTNEDAYRLIGQALTTMDHGLLFANVIEFDQSWGHRNDIQGFYKGLRDLDSALPGLVGLLRDDDLMILTADHGNDPTTSSTDHSREAVPILVVGPQVVPVGLGTRSTFADIGATVANYFGLQSAVGESFLEDIAPWAAS
ncbi:MAG: phosphopentomutase [Gemmatimonadales bacterium]